MKRRGKTILAVLVLILAYLAQRLWMSELNFFVWKITYIGEQVAFVLAAPDYDSAVSVEIFESVAIFVNALIYGAVLWLIIALSARLKSKRTARKRTRAA